MKFTFEGVSRPPEISENNWQDWKWQLRNAAVSRADLEKHFNLSESQTRALESGRTIFRVQATPYYLALAKKQGASPIKNIFLPEELELEDGVQAMHDPLAEKRNQPVNRIIHRYPDRVLFLITDICGVYCRFCTRKNFTATDQFLIPASDYKNALDYIREHPGIREVILSGGDPLTLSDAVLDRVLGDLRAIEHVEIIRIGSRMPVVTPMRLTTSLALILQKHQPVFLMTHFNHPKEITQESALALARLVNHGVPTFNQNVMLRGINNHAYILQALYRRLLFLRVKPYYAIQCDPSLGTDHLRTTIEDSEQIQRELFGIMSGLALPQFIVDVPDGGGKVPLYPDFAIEANGQGRVYRGFDGASGIYRNPEDSKRLRPTDFAEYEAEWNETARAKHAVLEQVVLCDLRLSITL